MSNIFDLTSGDKVYVKCRGHQSFTVIFVWNKHVILDDVYGKSHWVKLSNIKEKVV